MLQLRVLILILCYLNTACSQLSITIPAPHQRNDTWPSNSTISGLRFNQYNKQQTHIPQVCMAQWMSARVDHNVHSIIQMQVL
jgi:hypothetical protein